MRRALALLLFTVLLAARAAAADYWVWHRTSPLTPAEREALTAQGVTTLYWHVGEMAQRSGRWRWKTPPRSLRDAAPGFRVVPVVRLNPATRQPFAPAATLEALIADLRAVAGESGPLQIDYDCPDRLLPDYAAALQKVRRAIPHLSITALAQWPRVKGFDSLVRSVEEIVPMFYDLQADPTGVSAEVPPPPLLDPAQLAAVIRPWTACPIPWRAGLPNFARLTVFDRTGVSRGQIPNWLWEDFCFHKALRTLAPTRLGVTLFRADTDTRVAATPVAKDELVVSRFTDRAALAQAIASARSAGAKDVVFFRLPDGTGPAGWSLANLRDLAANQHPRLMLRAAADDRLELINASSIDLGPRLSGEKHDRDRGYALEIDAPGPLFREALAGDFWRVGAHAEPDAKKPIAVAVPLATRLTFWFSNLRAGATLHTGLLQLAPGASLDNVRYRILNSAENDAWKPVTLPPTSTPAP